MIRLLPGFDKPRWYSHETMVVSLHISESGTIIEKLTGPDKKIRKIFYYDRCLWAYVTEEQTFYQFQLG